MVNGDLTKLICLYYELLVEMYGKVWKCQSNLKKCMVSLERLVKELEEMPVCVSQEPRKCLLYDDAPCFRSPVAGLEVAGRQYYS